MKDSDRDELGAKVCTLEDESRGESEEKKSLKEKRDEERGGKKRMVLAEVRIELIYAVGFEK